MVLLHGPVELVGGGGVAGLGVGRADALAGVVTAVAAEGLRGSRLHGAVADRLLGILLVDDAGRAVAPGPGGLRIIAGEGLLLVVVAVRIGRDQIGAAVLLDRRPVRAGSRPHGPALDHVADAERLVDRVVAETVERWDRRARRLDAESVSAFAEDVLIAVSTPGGAGESGQSEKRGGEQQDRPVHENPPWSPGKGPKIRPRDLLRRS